MGSLSSWENVSRPSSYSATSHSLPITLVSSSSRDTLLSANRWLTSPLSLFVHLPRITFNTLLPLSTRLERMVVSRERRPVVAMEVKTIDRIVQLRLDSRSLQLQADWSIHYHFP